MAIKIPIRLLNIEGDGFHLQIKIRINGKAANAILDTGASKTVFDKTRIDSFLKLEKIKEHDRLSTGLGTASMKSHEVKLNKFSIGKLDIHDYTSVILDLSHVNQTYNMIGLKPIDGVVGSDVMEKYNAVIDYGKKILILNPVKVKKGAGKKGAGGSRKKSVKSKKKTKK
ncbi:MAG TPA: retropepsin-like aspartic protease [Bacteroidia bacterium]|nr:retropepsin-like aspartic protease [Bacteroidia bacterium]